MPLYEFECAKCHAVFEELVHTGSHGEGLACPSCGERKIGKRMSVCAGRMGQGKRESVGCPDGACCAGGACGLN